jgi:Phage integrase, N-terminal SAM-like domain
MARRTRGEGSVTFKKKLKLWAAKVPTDQVDAKGKRRYVYAYGKTKKEAARKRTLLQRQVEERTLPEQHRMTVEDLMTTYIENKVGRIKTRTMDLYSFDAKRHINPKIGHVLISKLMPLHIERM